MGQNEGRRIVSCDIRTRKQDKQQTNKHKEQAQTTQYSFTHQQASNSRSHHPNSPWDRSRDTCHAATNHRHR